MVSLIHGTEKYFAEDTCNVRIKYFTDKIDNCKYTEMKLSSNLNKETRKVLGMTWNTAKDEFNFDFSELYVLVNTQNIVKITAKLFDPLGLVSPMSSPIILQLIFESVCKDKQDWDTALTDNFSQEWYSFYKILNIINIS